MFLSAASAFAQTLPFHEGFEPSGGTPWDCNSENRGGWNYRTEWQACDVNIGGSGCPDDPVLGPCIHSGSDSRCWGPFKFESYPDVCAGGQVFAGYRAGRQPVADPYWHSMIHEFTPSTGVGDLRAQVMLYDSMSVVCTCECNCDPDGPLYGYPNGRPNYQIQGWLTLEDPQRTEAYAVGINSYSSWVYYSWFTKADGWHRTAVARSHGWHKLEIIVHPYSGQAGEVEFRIDDVTVGQGRLTLVGLATVPVSWVRLGGDPALITQNHLTNTFQQLWYDEVDLSFAPASCPESRSDLDRDQDVDMDDFGAFQLCYTGPVPAIPFNAAACHCVDYDGDQDVDDVDFPIFRSCASGADVPAAPGCGDEVD